MFQSTSTNYGTIRIRSTGLIHPQGLEKIVSKSIVNFNKQQIKMILLDANFRQ